MSRQGTRGALRDVATFVDQRAARVGLRFERPALISFLFHAIFDSQDEIDREVIHPQEAITREAFRGFVEHFLDAGYRFVSLAEVERGLEPSRYYVCVTFDDGYANNTRILETLREYRVPATVFVSTNYIATGKRYWWDTVYYERRLRGSRAETIAQEIESLETQTLEAIEAYLVREFGADANTPRADLDRPLTPQEVKELASDELITIGNHTMDHAILPLLGPAKIREQVTGAQTYLEDLIGTRASAISYPEGSYDESVVEITRRLGFSCGVTTVRRKDPVPIPPERLLTLGRYQFEARGDLDAQMRVMRSGLQFANAARRLRDRLR
jgi:peptidoglycan/xylan/chitin deacetylase (PgdA/CDA1 family)